MIKRIILITFCLIPLAVFAEPTTQRGKPNRPMPQFKRPASRPAEDPQEFNNALGFLDKYSPNRFKAYESLDDDRKSIFRDRILAFYRANQILNRDDNNGDEMRKLREKLIKAEDDVFGIRWDILASGGPRRASDEDKARLRSAVADMVRIQVQERTLRLDRLKNIVKGEEDQLSAMEKNPDQYIDQRYRDELEGRGLGLFDHPRRPGQGGPGGPNSNRSDGQGTGDKTPKKDSK